VSVAGGGPRARRRSSGVGCPCPRLGSGEARSRPLNGPILDLIAPIRPLQLCADGVYQLRFRSLEGTPNYGPRHLSQEPMTCIELSPYFENKITHEINCFRCSRVLLVRQAPPKGRGHVLNTKSGRRFGPRARTVRAPTIKLTEAVILISCVVIHLITWDLLSIT
jgi:hypothetical protein